MALNSRTRGHPVRESGTGLARALSKLGFCSRSQAWTLIEAGHVRLNGKVQRDGEKRVDVQRDHIEVDGRNVRSATKVYLMLNKPRGLVTTASDEKGRATVFQCLEGAGLPFLSPVGRLDQASEGLLLLTNDTGWAACIADPANRVAKTYHVQVDCVAGQELLERVTAGVNEGGEMLRAKTVRVLRQGQRNCWLEMILVEGRNRHIRRLLAALGVQVLRLVRVAIGPLQLGTLAKGAYRQLTPDEVCALAKPSLP